MTSVNASLRADNFCTRRALPEIEWMCQQLGQNVAQDVMRKVEAQLANVGLTKKDRQWWIAKLRFLSRVTADTVWDETVEQCIHIYHRQKIDRQVQPQSMEAK